MKIHEYVTKNHYYHKETLIKKFCPHDFNIELNKCDGNGGEVQISSCAKCWDQEIEEGKLC